MNMSSMLGSWSRSSVSNTSKCDVSRFLLTSQQPSHIHGGVATLNSQANVIRRRSRRYLRIRRDANLAVRTRVVLQTMIQPKTILLLLLLLVVGPVVVVLLRRWLQRAIFITKLHLQHAALDHPRFQLGRYLLRPSHLFHALHRLETESQHLPPLSRPAVPLQRQDQDPQDLPGVVAVQQHQATQRSILPHSPQNSHRALRRLDADAAHLLVDLALGAARPPRVHLRDGEEQEGASERDGGDPEAEVQKRHGAAVLRVERRVGPEVDGHTGVPFAQGREAAGHAANGQTAAELGGLQEALATYAFAELDEGYEEGLVAQRGVGARVENL